MPHIKMVANDHDIHGKPLRYLGAILGTTITRNFRTDLHDAVFADHPCEYDNHCDIGEALKEGYVYVAAHSLMGATDELPHVYRVIDAHRFNRTLPDDFGTDMYDNADWEGWKAHFDKEARECPGCGAWCFAEPGDNCSNCLAILGYREGDEVTFNRNVNLPDEPEHEVDGKVVKAVWDTDTRDQPIQWLDISVNDGEYIMHQIRSDYLTDTYITD